MPRFLVERDFGQVSGGGFKAFCVYTAPSSQTLDDHAAVMGGQGTHRIFQIVGDIDPREIAG